MTANINKHNFIQEPADSGLFCFYTDFTFALPKVGNIDVGFTQSAGFNVYGNGKQSGVRCFVLDENDPRNYKTYTKTYEQLCDGKLNTPIKDAIWRVVPTTVDMAKPMIAKALAALAAVVALIVIAVKFL